ncbi:MAG: NAD-dependent epimerase/dehydratase family protein [Bacteroidetes bacterium]|nr:MAG: NAD-dependent epimerase/dehydratase family protein [Bacteroidota bacterium]
MESKYKEFDNCSVLVVGGAGFVGSNLVKMILSSNTSVRVTVVDNLLSAERSNLPDDVRLTFIEGSIADDMVLIKLTDTFDYIFHLATYHGNQSSIYNPIADHANNTLTTLKLMEYVKGFRKIKKLVYSSAGCSVADKTFGEASATEEKEITSLKHDSPYSISKIIGEFYSLYYFNQHKLPTVRARFQNVYGPGEVLGAGKWRGTPATVWRNVTPTFIYKALNGLPIPMENEGIASRDFIFVDDICRGLIACALKGKAGDVYNIASGKEITIAELAKTIITLTGNKSKIEHLPKRPWDNSGKRFGSTVKSKKELGFEASVPLSEGLKTTVEWTVKNADRIKACMDKHKMHLAI